MTDDLDRIMAVMQTAFDARFGEAWTRRQVSDALILPGCRYLLADSDGAPLRDGDAAAGFTLSRRVLDEEELLLIAVRPEHRGRGIGRALLDRVVDEARQAGMRRLHLEMRDGNPAGSLYRRCDFCAVGRRKAYYRRGIGAPRDAITFARDIEKIE